MNYLQLIKRNLFHISLIGIFSILVMSSSFYYGVTSGNDLPQHYQFANTIYQSIVSGDIYPSWADTQNQGYGDAGIRFYPPLAYYALSISYILVGSWYNASLLTFFMIFWIGGIGVYFWAKENLSDNQALLAAGLYIFAPYHVNQIYNNFIYADFAASAVLPFCFLFVTRVCRRGNLSDTLGLSISFALLILTHLPMTIIGSLILAVYGMSLLYKGTLTSTLTKLGISVAIGTAASSFYWVRMITEMQWVKHSSEAFFLSVYDYRSNFLLAPQNILNFTSDASVLWFADLMLLAMLLIAIPSIIFFVKNRRSQSKISISIFLAFLVSVLMTTPISKIVWDNLFFLQKVQFPWRWMGIISMCGAVFAANGITHVAEAMNKNKSHLLSIGLGLILTFYAFMPAFVIKQAVYLPPDKFNTQIKDIESVNSFDCWWLIWSKNEALSTKEKAIAGERTVEIESWKPLERTIKVSAGDQVSLRIATFYYPHWKATVNNSEVSVQKDSDGVILIPVSQEESTVKLYFQEPSLVKTATYTSILMWLILFSGVFISIWKYFRNRFSVSDL